MVIVRWDWIGEVDDKGEEIKKYKLPVIKILIRNLGGGRWQQGRWDQSLHLPVHRWNT